MKELLRAVIEAPDDDAPRLVYADALMRAGDPRGELIALQLAGAPEAEALLAAHRAQWIAALPNVEEATFERGFASAIRLRCGRDALAVLDSEPVVSLALVCDGDMLEAARSLAADPRTSRIRTLDLRSCGWGEAAFRVLMSGAWSSLREVRVGDVDCQAYAAEVIAQREGITSLYFDGYEHAQFIDGISVLARAPTMSSLESLIATDCALWWPAGMAIGRSPHFSRLRRLWLGGGGNQMNILTDDGALELARSTSLPSVSELSLSHNDVTDAFLEALRSETALPALTKLVVSSCKRVTSAGFTALVASPRFATMQKLWAFDCAIDDDGVLALLQSPHAGALRLLDVCLNPITAVGARALADSPLAAQLESLAISLTPETEAILRPAFGARLYPAP